MRGSVGGRELKGAEATAHSTMLRAVQVVRRICPRVPPLAIVLGSGLADVGFESMREVSYAEVPGFLEPTIAGHSGRLIFGAIKKVPVLLLSGRSHFYEGRSLAEVTFPMRVLAALGVRDVLLTNAAGGINRRFRPGDFMIVTDHINTLPENPLRGLAGTEKFLDLSQVYDRALVKLLRSAAKRAGARAHTGVYVGVSGPSYETPAEIRAFDRWGGDAVGMSTVAEAIVARHCGMRVAGLSCITNFAAGRGKGLLSHAEVISAGKKARVAAEKLLNNFVTEYAQNQ